MLEVIGLKKGDYIAMTLDGKKRIWLERVRVIGTERAKAVRPSQFCRAVGVLEP